jgi:cytochrome c553
MPAHAPIYSRLLHAALCAPISACLLLAVQSADAAGSVKAGRDKAQKCEACHGLDGTSRLPEAPNLAGQVVPYLIGQLQAFKSGARKNDVMSVMAATLSPQDIEDLAAYYAAIEVTVGKLPAQ